MAYLDIFIKKEGNSGIPQKELVVGTIYTGRQLSSLGYDLSCDYGGRTPIEMHREKKDCQINGTNGIHHYVLRPIALDCFNSWGDVWFGVERKFNGMHEWLALYPD
ncbi:hypothetical protein HYW75_00995 [Candidatus Pacearchaeota archaeon]|nr:hypothetical protein [Candidatus Pacearchaeota archaeon]